MSWWRQNARLTCDWDDVTVHDSSSATVSWCV